MSDDQGSAPAGNPTAPAAAPAWYAPEGLDQNTTSQLGELVKAKGWKGPADALLSYQNLEKVVDRFEDVANQISGLLIEHL